MQSQKCIESDDGCDGEHGRECSGSFVTPYACGTVLCKSESVVNAIHKTEVVTLISSVGVKPYIKLLASEIQT